MNKHHILIVEDDTVIRTIMRIVLHSAGYQVHEAGDGDEALRQLAESSDPVDLVLLDQNMPNMDGIETLGHLRRSTPDTKVVMLSGMAPAELAHALGGAPVPCLFKPFNNHELVEAVRAALCA